MRQVERVCSVLATERFREVYHWHGPIENWEPEKSLAVRLDERTPKNADEYTQAFINRWRGVGRYGLIAFDVDVIDFSGLITPDVDVTNFNLDGLVRAFGVLADTSANSSIYGRLVDDELFDKIPDINNRLIKMRSYRPRPWLSFYRTPTDRSTGMVRVAHQAF